MLLHGNDRANFGAIRPRVVRAVPGGLIEQLSKELIIGKKKKPLILRQLSCVELNTLVSLCFKGDKGAIKIMGAYYWNHAKDMESYFGDRFLRLKALIGIKDKEVNILNDPRRQQLKVPCSSLDRKEIHDEAGSAAATNQSLQISETAHIKEFYEMLNSIETARSFKELDDIRIGQLNKGDRIELLNAIIERKQELQKELEKRRRMFQNVPPLKPLKPVLRKEKKEISGPERPVKKPKLFPKGKSTDRLSSAPASKERQKSLLNRFVAGQITYIEFMRE